MGRARGFDVVVGGGTAGCVMAARLAEQLAARLQPDASAGVRSGAGLFQADRLLDCHQIPLKRAKTIDQDLTRACPLSTLSPKI
ncbi:MAG TPA: hypothetical protein VIO57_07340 [Chloroflexota bacterium]